ncbi:MAG: DUF4363 family protein [Clostridia bacterium]|jgi:hypothetical protein|nr:DUF4363 family protein [Clostridia bacterium]
MVKSLICICVAALLLACGALCEWAILKNNFNEFQEELTALTRKLEEETANGEDAKAVQTSWEERKKRLHVWIPHNDVSRIDDYMSETVRLVTEGEYSLALAKVGIMSHLTECLPGTYLPHLENIF